MDIIFFSIFQHLQKDKPRKQRHSLKLGKKRRETSKRNYYIISPRVIIKAIIITQYCAGTANHCTDEISQKSLQHACFTVHLIADWLLKFRLKHTWTSITLTSDDPPRDSRSSTRPPLLLGRGSHQTDQGGWWVRAPSEELTSKCGKCKRTWPALQLAKEGCTDCKANPHRRQISPKKKKGAKPKLQQTLGIVMRSALPEEIEKIFHHNLSDFTVTLLHIQRCLQDIMQEMCISAADAPTSWVTLVPMCLWFTAPEVGHPLIDDNHDRPLHPVVGPFLRR